LSPRRYRVPLSASAAAAVLLFASISPAGFQRVDDDARFNLWRDAASLVADKPIFGHAFGTAADRSLSSQVRSFADPGIETHSSWIDIALEQGLFALVMWGLVLMTALRRALRVDVAVAGTILGGLVSATFESWLFSLGSGLGVVFWLTVGSVMALRSTPHTVAGARPAYDSPNHR
jgi:O-antigen ligase